MLRIGILGAARVAPMAVIEPARRRPDVEVVAIAALRPGAAVRFASDHAIPIAYRSYEELISDPDIDLVYNALPPASHAHYSIMALEAGKHVLCEKPFALNAREARAMNAAAARWGRRIFEAFHDRYHPVFRHLMALKADGRFGEIRRLTGVFNHTMSQSAGEFRYRPELGGGVLMDYGCYPIHWCRSFAEQPPVVTEARVKVGNAGVEEEVFAILSFPGGIEASIESRMTDGWDMHARFIVEAEKGSVCLVNNILPHRGHSVISDLDGVAREYTLAGGTTFDHQLEAILAVIETGERAITEGDDPVANMAVIDAVYRAAGMPGHGLQGALS
jgi:predicted dehydrogenase